MSSRLLEAPKLGLINSPTPTALGLLLVTLISCYSHPQTLVTIESTCKGSLIRSSDNKKLQSYNAVFVREIFRILISHSRVKRSEYIQQ